MNVLNYVSIFVLIIIIPLFSHSFENDDDHHGILNQLQKLIDAASDDKPNEIFLEQLTELLRNEEGLELISERDKRSIDDRSSWTVDGSGDFGDEEDIPPIMTNLSIVAFTMGPSTTAFTKFTPQSYPSCPCQKGDHGEKGDPGICPTDCGHGYSTYQQNCLGPKLNLDRLAQSIRQLITDTKKIAFRNARASSSCTCPAVPSTTTMSTPMPFDYNMYTRLKGEKGDRGDSCPSGCTDISQSNVRVFRTLQQAIDTSSTYPDHTYVHIVNDYGQLQGVFIHIHGRLIPIRLEGEVGPGVQSPTSPTGLSFSSSKCTLTLPCSTLHLFALGPNVRRMCHPRRPDTFCSKLSDFDDLCSSIAESHHLKGYYRAFMSTTTQWLSNIFAGVCVSAKMVNMKEQTLFTSVNDMFEQKTPQNEIYDVQGMKPQFQYWWHGSLLNGTGSSDTCSDWSRRDSRLSGIASRLPDGSRGLFHSQYTWPCSISDSNMGILCIETNCDKRNSYKH